MSTRIAVDVHVHIAAAPDTVWPRITAHEEMAAWWPGLREVRLDPPGTPDRDGLGAVRVMRSVGKPVREQVIAWDPPYRYEYRVLDFAPMRDHLGRVSLSAADGGTAVEWHVEWQPTIPFTGALMRSGLRWMLGTALRRFKQQLDGERRA